MEDKMGKAISCIVLAAGAGRRMAYKENKIFIPLGQYSIIQRTIQNVEKIEGLKEIKLFNRRDEFFDKALAFAQRVNENTDCVVTVTDLADQQAFAEALASADILTNGTKVGMKPLENESLVNDISLLHPGLLVTECVYNPHMTKLLQQAQQAGCKTIDGYGMLLWQGAEQFTLWTGKDFPLEYVKQVMGFGA